MPSRRCKCPRLGGCAWCTLLSVPDAAAAVDVPAGTVRVWISRGQLAVHRQGGRVYVLEADLLECDRARRHSGHQHRLADRA